jgi:hypothetical protein
VAFPYVIPPMRPVTQADVHGAVNALLGNPKPRPRAGMFGGGKAPRPRENLQPARETVASKVEDTARNALLALGLNKYSANMLGQRTFNFLNDLTPVGSAVSFDHARQDYNQGNYGSALGNALLGAISAVPEVGKGAGVVSHAIIAPLFHGSPHKFEKFALEKIGTGEGAQAYGHGLYFAENPEVAKQYQSTVSLQHGNVDWGNDPASAAAYWLGMHKDRDGAIRTFETVKKQHQAILNRAAKGLPIAPGAEANSLNEIAQADAAIEHIRNGTERKGLGHLYEVKLDANPEDFLNWDAKLGEQPDIASRVSTLDNPLIQAWQQNGAFPHVSGQTLYRQLADGLTNGAAARGVPVTASQSLNAAGIPGIRYLDQGSRGAGAGTHNYVVFDPSIIDILNRN